MAVVSATIGRGRLNRIASVAISQETLFLHGSGVGETADEAIVPAFAEAMERYATSIVYEEQSIWRPANDLDSRALDLDAIPQCSADELAGPWCSLVRPSKSQPIRWVQGISLDDGDPIYVPAVMVYSHIGWRGAQERFWLPISTGCAAHESYEKATLHGICEVVERDAISIVWLQQLALPRIVVDRTGPLATPYWNLYQQASADVDYHFFNATTDVGLPTIYGIQVSRFHPYARTTVACSTGLTFDQALAKVIRDLTSFKRAFVAKRELPADIGAFTGVLDGASYMAQPMHEHVFKFLLNSDRQVSLSELSVTENAPLRTLSDVLARLISLGMKPLAVDLTTDESVRAGLRVVRVLIPELQPLSLHTAVQYLAHPRVYEAPTRMGYSARDEANLNRWPQPFA